MLLPQYFAAHGYRTLGTGKLLHHSSQGLYDKYFTTEQRWSPLGGKQQVSYTKKELLTKTINPRHVVRFGLDNTEIVLPLNRMGSDRNPTGANGESFDWGPFDVEDDEMGTARSQSGQSSNWRARRISRSFSQSATTGRTSRSGRRGATSIFTPSNRRSCPRC